jgi:hypothetical protein
MNAEAEEPPLLEAVTRKRQVKTMQAGEDLVIAVVICEVWRLEVTLQLLVVPSRVVKWSINRVTNPNPVYNYTYYVTVLSSEMSVNVYKTSRLHVLDFGTLHSHSCENLRPTIHSCILLASLAERRSCCGCRGETQTLLDTRAVNYVPPKGEGIPTEKLTHLQFMKTNHR